MLNLENLRFEVCFALYLERKHTKFTVGTNRRQFLRSENETCFKAAFCPKQELSLPLWISSRAMLLMLCWCWLFFDQVVLDSLHTHTCAPLWSSLHPFSVFAECPGESFTTVTVWAFSSTSMVCRLGSSFYSFMCCYAKWHFKLFSRCCYIRAC